LNQTKNRFSVHQGQATRTFRRSAVALVAAAVVQLPGRRPPQFDQAATAQVFQTGFVAASDKAARDRRREELVT
jgi:hypothetical protein